MRFIRVVAFVSGLVVLGIEITAFRIVAPFFGNSIFVTSNILAVILAGLSLGYWAGGWLADRARAARPLFVLMIATSLVTSLVPFVAPALLGLLRAQVETVDWRLVVFSLLGCVVLFLVPFMLLGMVSPWLVHLGTDKHEHRGKSAGSIYAWSTLGSLLGTFLPTLVLVPTIGSKKTILLLSGALALVGALGLAQKKWIVPVAVIVLAAVGITPGYFGANGSVLAERESSVEYLRVVRDSESAVHLEQDEGLGVHSIYNADQVVTGSVFDWLSLAPELRAGQAREQDELSVGIIGLAGGTVARQLETWFGPDGSDPHDLSVRGAELDPETLQLAREYFGLDQLTTLEARAADGRVWLASQQTPFDVIVVDAFRQLYIPAHLTSREFFELVRSKLAPDGVIAVNLNVVGENSIVEQTVTATIASVFPNVQMVPIPGSFNIVYYASGDPEAIDLASASTRVKDLQFALKTVQKEAQTVPEPDKSARIATDDRPLVESLYDLMVGRSLLK